MPAVEADRWMARALELARRGWGHVQPNPMVGALVLDADGHLAGEGHHAVFGGPHAEVVALNAAGHRTRGGTLFVTLEPCTHHGKTPPCTDAIRSAGITRVVAAAPDPSSEAGGGAALLRSAGVTVDMGVREQEARDLNAAFYHTHSADRPFVALKYALSLDARLSARRGAPARVTGAEALDEAHRLRAGFDALMIGIGTALADDPRLTVRRGVEARRQPTRVVLDSNLRLPPDSRLLGAAAPPSATWIVCAEDAPAAAEHALAGRGAHVVRVRRGSDGVALPQTLRRLGAEGMSSVLVEGGGELGSALLRAGLVDRHYVFHAPVLLGSDGTPAYDDGAAAATRRWRRVRSMPLGDDVLVELAPPLEED